MQHTSSSSDLSDPAYRECCDPETEKKLANAYFNRHIEAKTFDQTALRHFGTVTSVVGKTAVIAALPTFDLIDQATLKAGDAIGEIFDVMGEQFNPLYIASFSSEVKEGQVV